MNATTSNESTNYYFCISAPSMSSLHQGKGGKDSHTGSASSLDQKEVEADESPLLKALDIFSQFFVAPLFTESATKRELDAVESEFVNGLQDDDRRNFQVAKVLLCENHPLHRFSCGNVSYPKGILRRDMIETSSRASCIFQDPSKLIFVLTQSLTKPFLPYFSCFYWATCDEFNICDVGEIFAGTS